MMNPYQGTGTAAQLGHAGAAGHMAPVQMAGSAHMGGAQYSMGLNMSVPSQTPMQQSLLQGSQPGTSLLPSYGSAGMVHNSMAGQTPAMQLQRQPLGLVATMPGPTHMGGAHHHSMGVGASRLTQQPLQYLPQGRQPAAPLIPNLSAAGMGRVPRPLAGGSTQAMPPPGASGKAPATRQQGALQQGAGSSQPAAQAQAAQAGTGQADAKPREQQAGNARPPVAPGLPGCSGHAAAGPVLPPRQHAAGQSIQKARGAAAAAGNTSSQPGDQEVAITRHSLIHVSSTKRVCRCKTVRALPPARSHCPRVNLMHSGFSATSHLMTV